MTSCPIISLHVRVLLDDVNLSIDRYECTVSLSSNLKHMTYFQSFFCNHFETYSIHPHDSSTIDHIIRHQYNDLDDNDVVDRFNDLIMNLSNVDLVLTVDSYID